jgi:hypothetical protein
MPLVATLVGGAMVYVVSVTPRGILDLLTPVAWVGVFLVVVGTLKLCSRKVTVTRVFVGFGIIFTAGAIFRFMDSVSVLNALIFGFSMFAMAFFRNDYNGIQALARSI